MFSSRIINSKQLRTIKSLIIIVNLNLKGYTFIHTVVCLFEIFVYVCIYSFVDVCMMKITIIQYFIKFQCYLMDTCSLCVCVQDYKNSIFHVKF
jgi:uncharacterized protein YebE (UPF0316 family)